MGDIETRECPVAGWPPLLGVTSGLRESDAAILSAATGFLARTRSTAPCESRPRNRQVAVNVPAILHARNGRHYHAQHQQHYRIPLAVEDQRKYCGRVKRRVSLVQARGRNCQYQCTHPGAHMGCVMTTDPSVIGKAALHLFKFDSASS